MKTLRDMMKIIVIPLIILVVPYILIMMPMFFGYYPFEVTFDSMSPTYKDGDFVYFTRVASSDIHEGDLIVYDEAELEHGRIFHRVMGEAKTGYYTKGDDKVYNDNYIVTYDKVIGKASDKHIPFLGPYIKFINENETILYIALGTFSVFFLVCTACLIQERKEIKKELAVEPVVEPKQEEKKEENKT